MKLFLLRHGIAVDHGTPGYERDSERPLTAEGRAEMKQIAKAMGVLKLDFDLILSSPFVRAKETAEIVAHELQLENKMAFSLNLRSGADNAKLVQELQAAHAKKNSILLAGHEPNLSALISVLVSGDQSMAIDFKKGGFCKLVTDRLEYGRCAYLKWLMTPRQMIKISQS